ncbi:MAG TPA: DUF4258 domain-containing protein [Chitinophagaceae bacterium]
MNKKWLPLALVIVLGIALFFVRRLQKSDDKAKPKTTDTRTDPASNNTNRDRGFDRRVSYLEYSNHAKCRMGCRKITQKEVEEIMKDGKINYNKSDLQNARCPRYAIEGTTSDDQRVRIVFAQCNDKTVVVTVIDLGTEWSCDCLGDDNKYENKN